MPTMITLIELAERDLSQAKASGDRDAATDAGRHLASTRFAAECERWLDRLLEGDIEADPFLLDLAPRHRGAVDWDWLAAMHLQRIGVKVPQGWRSEATGERLATDHRQPDPRGPAR
jgi:hypothetical protein